MPGTSWKGSDYGAAPDNTASYRALYELSHIEASSSAVKMLGDVRACITAVRKAVNRSGRSSLREEGAAAACEGRVSWFEPVLTLRGRTLIFDVLASVSLDSLAGAGAMPI